MTHAIVSFQTTTNDDFLPAAEGRSDGWERVHVMTGRSAGVIVAPVTDDAWAGEDLISVPAPEGSGPRWHRAEITAVGGDIAVAIGADADASDLTSAAGSAVYPVPEGQTRYLPVRAGDLLSAVLLAAPE